MANEFHLEIHTPEKTVYRGEIISLVAPAALGYVGILAHHAPFIAYIVPGRIAFTDNVGQATVMHTKKTGFMEVINNNATLLLDSVD